MMGKDHNVAIFGFSTNISDIQYLELNYQALQPGVRTNFTNGDLVALTYTNPALPKYGHKVLNNPLVGTIGAQPILSIYPRIH